MQKSKNPTAAAPPLSAVNDVQLQEKILNVAQRCFKRFGVRRTRLEDIAAEAGVSRPLLYKVFGNRQTLIETLVAREVEYVVRAQADRIADCSSFTDAIIEGSVRGIELCRKATVLSDMMANSTVLQMPDLVLDKDKPFNAIAMRTWKPVFDTGRASGELREDLSDDDVFEWLMSVHYMFLLRNELGADRMRRLLRLFLSLH